MTPARVWPKVRACVPRWVRQHCRRTWRWLTRPHFEVVYHEQYNHADANIPVDPLRAERILAFLASEGLVLRRDVHTPLPASLRTLQLVHGEAYLEQVHEIPTLTSIMGVEVTPDQVDRLLDLQRLQTGGTVLATRLALAKGVAVNLGGGFHHARGEQGGGFCIFNDVAVAIADARRKGFAGRVLIIDLDLHDGDGTRDLFADDDDVFTFSIHARGWSEDQARSSLSVELGSEVDDDLYLEAVERHLPGVLRQVHPRLVFYLAGTDPAREDKIGEWNITPDGMLRRDVRVASLVRTGEFKAPLVIVLAGGYSQESWRYTSRFLSAPLGRRVAIEPPSTEVMTFKRYRYITSLFDQAELTGASSSNEFGLTEEDLYLPGWASQKETRFLGYYTRHGIELVLQRAGILQRLRDMGFRHPTLEFNLEDLAGHTMRMYSSPSRDEVLMEIRLRTDRRSIEGSELLSIEWLLLQNPRSSFGPGRSRLPGQNHPGLGMLKDTVALLATAGRRLHLDGIIYVPSTYHVAVQWAGSLKFLDPDAEARFKALKKLLRDKPLAEATKAVAEGRVIDDETGEAFPWRPTPMVAPLTRRLKRQLRARERDSSASEYQLGLLPGVEAR